MHGDVAEIGFGMGRIDGSNVLHAGGEQLPGIVSFFPPCVRREGVSHGFANRGEMLVDPLASIIEGNLRSQKEFDRIRTLSFP